MCRRLFPDRKDVALVALSIAFFTPGYTAFYGMISSDNLAIILVSFVLLGLVRHMQSIGAGYAAAVFLGVLTGLAMLAKKTSVSLLPVFTVACLFRKGWRVRDLVGWHFVFLAACLVTQSWYMIWLNREYGDPFGVAMMNIALGDIRHVPTVAYFVDGFNDILRGVFNMYVGWALIMIPPPLSHLIFFLAILVVIGLATYVLDVAWRRALEDNDKKMLFLVAVLVSQVALLLLHNLQYSQSMVPRYLMPCAGVLGVLAPFAAYQAARFRGILLSGNSSLTPTRFLGPSLATPYPPVRWWVPFVLLLLLNLRFLLTVYRVYNPAM
jgi:hypothetical protein